MDSFIIKFKNIWKSGRNANFTIKSNAGKAEVFLRHIYNIKIINGWSSTAMWLGEDVCFSNAAAKGVTGNVTSAVEANSESANAS